MLSRRALSLALLALVAAVAVLSASVAAAPGDNDGPRLSPGQQRRAEREAAAAAAEAPAAPAPAPSKSKTAKAAAAAPGDLLPTTGKANTRYYVNARSALYTPSPKDSDKPGKLKLEGVSPTILSTLESADESDEIFGRVRAGELLGAPKTKERLPAFDRNATLETVLIGDRGKNSTSLFLVLSNPRGFKPGKDSSVEFDAAPLSEAKEEADNSDVKAIRGLTRAARVADSANGQKVRLDDVVALVAAYSPHGDQVIKRAKEVAAGTYVKKAPAKKAAKAAKSGDDDDEKEEKKAAAAPAPSKSLGEKVKDTTKERVSESKEKAADVGSKISDKASDAKDAVVDKVTDAKDKTVAAVTGRRLMTSFIDLNPNGRRLMQDGPNCGVCEYADKSGACKVAPASLDCDGIVGMSGEWNCGTCETYTNNDFLGYCETIPGC